MNRCRLCPPPPFPTNGLRVLLLWTLILGGCTGAGRLQAQPADAVYLNGHIYTADAGQSFASSIAVTGNTLVHVGDDAGAEPFIGPSTTVIDLDGGTVLPGLFDTHIHLLEAGSEGAASCVLPYNAGTISQLVNALVNCDPQPNSNGWIFSWGHSIYTLLESGQNPLDLLTNAFPNTPVAAMDETSHSAWVNQAALDALGITGSTPDPEGGHIVLDADGEPFGLLLDAAGDLAFQAVYATNADIEAGDYNGLVNFGLPAMAASGITSITEGRTYWKRHYPETWQQVYDDGLLTVRTDLTLYAHPEDEDDAQMDSLLARYDEGDEWLRARQIKLYLDGITLNGTAAMEAPYIYPFGWPFDDGLNYFTPERLTAYITALEVEGFDFHIHTIGNRGVREALDAIQAARTANGDIGARHQLTHIEWVNASDIPRFAELDVTANAQVTAWWTQPNTWQDNAYLIGNEVANAMIPIGSIHDAGGRVTLSSDWDVSSYNPFRSLENAVTRAPEALPSVADAVDAKTIEAAHSSRSDSYTGSLEIGKRADFICIDQDIFSIAPAAISETHVVLTVVDGEVVHEDGGIHSVAEPDRAEPVLALYPTIANTAIHLRVKEAVSYRICDAAGRVWMEDRAPAGRSAIDISALEEGLHLMTALFPSGPVTRRFLVVR